MRELNTVLVGGVGGISDDGRPIPWRQALAAADAARPLADASADADIALLALSARAHDVCNKLARAAASRGTAEASSSLSAATVFAAVLHYNYKQATQQHILASPPPPPPPPPPLLLPLSRLVGALLCVRAAAAAAAAANTATTTASSVLRVALLAAASDGAVIFINGGACIAPVIADALPRGIILAADAELSAAATLADDADANAAALARCAVIEDALCAHGALRSRAAESLVSGLQAALNAEDKVANESGDLGCAAT